MPAWRTELPFLIQTPTSPVYLSGHERSTEFETSKPEPHPNSRFHFRQRVGVNDTEAPLELYVRQCTKALCIKGSQWHTTSLGG
jgi:hypothetical protein